MCILSAFFSAKPANFTVFRILVVLVTDIFLWEASRFQKTSYFIDFRCPKEYALKRDLPQSRVNIIHFSSAPIPVDSHFVNLSHDRKMYQPYISPHHCTNRVYFSTNSNTFYPQLLATNNRNSKTSISLLVTQSNNIQISSGNISHNITANGNTRCNTTLLLLSYPQP